ncbi:Beta-1, 4-N-acetylgalactosaminyltransferase bre-4 [Sarcoptes scabiei]|uniref:Beta-1,4-N-acetylgalactosaminyltransferase bre-4 n=2 Tax=Sarcoptes scabiei TaxID=52283 RepID=A0A834RDX6_SARSC|nr:Beta-1, 4-N-acetylgalactosaminyltransferase bre-4 [Sarcoptes scabiei]
MFRSSFQSLRNNEQEYRYQQLSSSESIFEDSIDERNHSICDETNNVPHSHLSQSIDNNFDDDDDEDDDEENRITIINAIPSDRLSSRPISNITSNNELLDPIVTTIPIGTPTIVSDKPESYTSPPTSLFSTPSVPIKSLIPFVNIDSNRNQRNPRDHYQNHQHYLFKSDSRRKFSTNSLFKTKFSSNLTQSSLPSPLSPPSSSLLSLLRLRKCFSIRFVLLLLMMLLFMMQLRSNQVFEMNLKNLPQNQSSLSSSSSSSQTSSSFLSKNEISKESSQSNLPDLSNQSQSKALYLKLRTILLDKFKKVDRASGNISIETNTHPESSSTKSFDLEQKFSIDNQTLMVSCPSMPPNLVGRLNVSFESPEMETLERMFQNTIELGGRYRPKSCQSNDRVAIIIPYREREKHLRTFLLNMHPILMRQNIDYGIFVIEQYGKLTPFNRAKLMNVGFLESRKQYPFDCFFFHDVDLIPEDDRNLYTCPKQSPKHMSVAIDKFHYKLPYASIFGGVSALTAEQFIKVNGFSNQFWGWGGEDDDMSNRIHHYGLNISRYPIEIARYKMLKHEQTAPNADRFKKLYNGWRRFKTDGISSIKYRVIDLVYRKLYTWILADLYAPKLRKN